MSIDRQPFKLPYDVMLNIITMLLAEGVDSESRQFRDTLKTFSLVSRHLVTFCQKQLFKKYDMGRMKNQKYYLILKHSPHLIAYVREVWMYLGSSERGAVADVTVAEMEVPHVLTSVRHLSVVVKDHVSKWGSIAVSVRRTIAELLNRPQITSFTTRGLEAIPFALLSRWFHLTSLEIRDDNLAANFKDIDWFSPTDVERLERSAGIHFNRFLLSTPPRKVPYSTVNIRLEDISLIDSDRILWYMLLDPEDILDNERNRLLFIPPPTWPTEPILDNGSGLTPTEYAYYRNNMEKIDQPFRFDFTHVRRLTIDLTAKNLFPVWHLIRQAQDSLTALDIRQRYNTYSGIDPFGFDSSFLPNHTPITLPAHVTLGYLNNLRTLSITILILVDMPASPDTLSSWCSLLRTVPAGIRSLEITLDAFCFTSIENLTEWFPISDDEDEEDIVTNTPLSSLDHILSSPQYFPSLECVTIRVDLPEDERSEGNSEAGMIFDVVTEEDVPAFDAWSSAHDEWWRKFESKDGSRGLTEDVVTEEDLAMYETTGGDYVSPDDSSSGSSSSDLPSSPGQPSFSDEDSMWSRSYPIAFARVEESIARMLQLTSDRFSSAKSFVVEVDLGGQTRR